MKSDDFLADLEAQLRSARSPRRSPAATWLIAPAVAALLALVVLSGGGADSVEREIGAPAPDLADVQVAVFNGSTRTGLAGAAAAQLRQAGYDDVTVLNLPFTDLNRSAVIPADSGADVAAATVAAALGLAVVPSASLAADARQQAPAADVLVLLGGDRPTPAALADAAGCELRAFPSEGREHEARSFTASDYATNPPTSGAHFPEPAADGVYSPGATPPLGKLVHSLEHGRIHYQYAPVDVTPTDVNAVPNAAPALLSDLARESDGYHVLVYENTTGMTAPIAATAWTHSLTCPSAGDDQIAALRAFGDAYLDEAPERVP
ncbi:MAG: DUF3105 domain-containing protein [Solirubrobacteraceae bacterium]